MYPILKKDHESCMAFYELIQEVLGIAKECIKVDVNTTVADDNQFANVKYKIELSNLPKKEPENTLKCLIELLKEHASQIY